MKGIAIAILGLLIGQTAMAGDAGYFSRTCVSSTQRTVLTLLNDYTFKAPIYTLILDGVPAIFDLSDRSVSTEGDDGLLTISKDGVHIFKSEFRESSGKMNLTIFVDHREGTIAQHGASPTPISVQLKCTDFWPNP